jgi:hypothetical protein
MIAPKARKPVRSEFIALARDFTSRCADISALVQARV